MTAKRQVHWGSITVSVDKLSFPDQLFILAALVGVLIWSFPHASLAQSGDIHSQRFEVNNLATLIGPPEDYFAKFLAEEIPPKPVDPRLEPLRTYLLNKNSLLADQAELLLEQYHYRLILGISFAESNFCKHQIRPNNCWGIGGGNPKQYETLTHGIIRTNELIQKYQNLGMTTPKLMRDTWVGWTNHNWVLAVEQVTKELENQGI